MTNVYVLNNTAEQLLQHLFFACKFDKPKAKMMKQKGLKKFKGLNLNNTEQHAIMKTTPATTVQMMTSIQWEKELYLMCNFYKLTFSDLIS